MLLTRIVIPSFRLALEELKANKLRTLLSLSGVTIGIFCIIAIFTLLDSLERNIRNNVASLGDNVLYISKWPWMDEGGTYKWWEYQRRPVMTLQDQKALEQKAQTLQYAALSFSENNITVKNNATELGGITMYGVTPHFEKMQHIELQEGRYLNLKELLDGGRAVVIGSEVAGELFPGTRATGRELSFSGQKFHITGVLKKTGNTLTGFDFDNGIILPYNAAALFLDVHNSDADVTLLAKAKSGIDAGELALEAEGILRAGHRIAPGGSNDFSINKLSQVTERLNSIFGTIDLAGMVIGFFSLLVGGFGIANIMFVSVKERTRIIGLKKALGARKSAILSEFLTEAVTLCLIGGLAGMAAVVLLGAGISRIIDFPVVLSLKNFFTGITISTLIGILSGYIPAKTAANLDPVAAIRSI